MHSKLKLDLKTVLWILGLAAVVALLVLNFQRQNRNKAAQKNISGEKGMIMEKVDLPVALGSKNVGAVFVQYFFNANIKEVKPFPDGGAELVLDTDNTAIPKVLVSPKIPVNRIPPSEGKTAPDTIKLSDLKPGMNVDVSMQYDPVMKNWIMLGVMQRADKNK